MEMQRLIGAEKCDLFDVLGYVAYALEPLTREERAAKAMALISNHFNSKQQVFLDFVLSHYINVGVEELDAEKLTASTEAQVPRFHFGRDRRFGQARGNCRDLQRISAISLSHRLVRWGLNGIRPPPRDQRSILDPRGWNR